MSTAILEVLHIVSVISWMAGMLYLPRLFVYHAQSQHEETIKTFEVMERKLLRYIMNPAMIATWVFGLWLMMELEYFRQGWMHTKLLLVCLMTFVHHLLARHRKRFLEGKNTKTPKYFKILNEAPTVLMIGIVAMVVLKPF